MRPTTLLLALGTALVVLAGASPAPAQVDDTGAQGETPLLQVVSTRIGDPTIDSELQVAESSQRALPWLAAGTLAVAAGLVVGGLTVTSTSALAGPSRRHDGESGPGSGRARRPPWPGGTPALAIAVSIAVFLLAAVTIGGLDG